ncbi:hypothetical protein EVJ58_g5939 [Rhodofomes roseus]|uniref:Uncharacterized protein n=1 Tax=Rhodofomes roseus TaxID=34475 RepID=A0A4Y9Y9J8_9APHY|nr:hypothetical protein EVJ58_g5939 [Rhodofomes roseus]
MEKKCASSSIVLAGSLDPPNCKRKLQRPFAFTKSKLRYEQVEGYLTVVEPFEVLPRLLVPSRRVAYKPPIMHYGWRAPRDFLLDYARKHRLTRQYGRHLNEYERMVRALVTINKRCGSAMSEDLLKLLSTLIGSLES